MGSSIKRREKRCSKIKFKWDELLLRSTSTNIKTKHVFGIRSIAARKAITRGEKTKTFSGTPAHFIQSEQRTEEGESEVTAKWTGS